MGLGWWNGMRWVWAEVSQLKAEEKRGLKWACDGEKRASKQMAFLREGKCQARDSWPAGWRQSVKVACPNREQQQQQQSLRKRPDVKIVRRRRRRRRRRHSCTNAICQRVAAAAVARPRRTRGSNWHWHYFPVKCRTGVAVVAVVVAVIITYQRRRRRRREDTLH